MRSPSNFCSATLCIDANCDRLVVPRQTLTNPIFPSGASSSPFEIQAVPTNVAKGPDGAYYISQLTGFPFPEGEAKIYRVGADGKPIVYTDGFTQLTDLDFDVRIVG